MTQSQGNEDELTLWVLCSLHRSDEAHFSPEITFIYARDSQEAEMRIERWRELHPEYILKSYEMHPEGYTHNNVSIPGKKPQEADS